MFPWPKLQKEGPRWTGSLRATTLQPGWWEQVLERPAQPGLGVELPLLPLRSFCSREEHPSFLLHLKLSRAASPEQPGW